MVAEFDFDKDLKRFKNYVTAASQNVPQEKLDLFKDAIFVANTNGQLLPLKDLGTCIKLMLGLQKVSAPSKVQLRDKSIVEWPQVFKTLNDDAFINK